jgi:integrase
MASFEKRTLSTGEIRWRYKVFAGLDGLGKRKFICGTVPTKKDAEKEARRLEGLRDQSSLTLPSKETVAAYLRSWLENTKKGSVRERTWSGYSDYLRRYLENPPPGAPPFGRVRMDKLSPEHLQRFYGWMREGRGLAAGTIRQVHAVLRQGLAHATRTGAIGRNPAAGDLIVLPKIERREVRAMSKVEARRFLESAQEDRYHALWVLLLTCGLRPSEAFALTWEDVDWEEGRIHIQRSLTRQGVEGWKIVPPKTSRGRRVVVLPEVALKALRGWRKIQIEERLETGPKWKDHGFVFTTKTGLPLDSTNLNSENYLSVMQRAGLGEEGPPRKKPRSGPTGTWWRTGWPGPGSGPSRPTLWMSNSCCRPILSTTSPRARRIPRTRHRSACSGAAAT